MPIRELKQIGLSTWNVSKFLPLRENNYCRAKTYNFQVLILLQKKNKIETLFNFLLCNWIGCN